MIGARLGCWVLERELGRGGMGAVYLARREGGSPELPERAAVKVLAPQLHSDSGFLARFQREIEVLGKLSHPNIVRLLEAGEQDGRQFYAMEYVEGPSLEMLLAESSRLPWAEVLDLALQIASALKHAHAHGIIHRDLKPSNLLRGQPVPPPLPSPLGGEGKGWGEIGRFGIIKLTDFGIAWVFAGEHLTVTGAVVGTPEYLSPEQAAGKTPTKKSDLYSLGAVLYTLLAGRPPFTGEVVDVLHKQRYGQYEQLSRLVPDLPPDFERVICDLLEKDPEKRPADAGVLQRNLNSLRRKYDRKAQQNTSANLLDDTGVEADREKSHMGPATMMAHLMREELNVQKHGGPLQRLFNHPLVLFPLFFLTVGIIIWAFLPPSPERMFQRAASLMSSSDPDDWEKALDEYLERLREKHPHFREDEVEAFIRKAQRARDRRQEARNARLSGPMSEAHWFYEEGVRLRQQGKGDKAKEVWRNLIAAFGDVPDEGPWVELARRDLSDNPSKRERTGDDRWASVRRALELARDLEKEGKQEQASRIRQALKALYADDPSAKEILGK
jgi:serine/threonine-protein kinase